MDDIGMDYLINSECSDRSQNINMMWDGLGNSEKKSIHEISGQIIAIWTKLEDVKQLHDLSKRQSVENLDKKKIGLTVAATEMVIAKAIRSIEKITAADTVLCEAGSNAKGEMLDLLREHKEHYQTNLKVDMVVLSAYMDHLEGRKPLRPLDRVIDMDLTEKEEMRSFDSFIEKEEDNLFSPSAWVEDKVELQPKFLTNKPTIPQQKVSHIDVKIQPVQVSPFELFAQETVTSIDPKTNMVANDPVEQLRAKLQVFPRSQTSLTSRPAKIPVRDLKYRFPSSAR